MEALERRSSVNKVAAGEDIHLTGDILAIAITTTRIVTVLHWRHFLWNPALSSGEKVGFVGWCAKSD
jgi:hypothetical protein